MSGSESSEDDANIPPAAECDRRCKEFATITDTDSACAMFYLQDRDWDVQRALNAYFGERGLSQPKKRATEDADGAASVAAAAVEDDKTEEPDTRIRLLSWNTDGIDTNNVLNRAKAVSKIILQENPDVVFLQEVVPATVEVYEKKCPQYQFLSAGTQGYFCAMMLRASSVVLKEQSVLPFFSSMMSRNLLMVKATVKGVDMNLMTSHLESMGSHAAERKRQLQKAFDEVKSAPPKSTVIFGGDLNIRDKELAALGGVPKELFDLWEETGKRPEAKYTWDMARNDNLEMPGNAKPRLRFDRLYLRHPSTGPKALKPVYFELVGIQRLKVCKRFPSDHWGILTHFDKIAE